MKLSVIIPMYNEEKIVGDTIKTLDASLKKSFADGEYEMLFVSDGSIDNCRAAAESLSGAYPALRVLGYDKNRGKGAAVRLGMLEAKGEFVLFTDCDLAYGADIINDFYGLFLSSHADIVIGSRAAGGGGYDGYTFLRKVMSKVYLKIVCIVAGFDLSDSQCGIKGFSNNAARKIFSICKADGFEFDLEAIMIGESFGYKIEEKPVRIINHRASKVSPVKDSLKMLRQIHNIKKREKQRKKDAAAGR